MYTFDCTASLLVGYWFKNNHAAATITRSAITTNSYYKQFFSQQSDYIYNNIYRDVINKQAITSHVSVLYYVSLLSYIKVSLVLRSGSGTFSGLPFSEMLRKHFLSLVY